MIEFIKEAAFLGPKAEHAKTWSEIINFIFDDYVHWRRNYFPEDDPMLGREERRAQESWFDLMSNELDKVLSQLKADVPIYSPRYQAHMVSENLLPGVVGYLAGMLYNPNNVSREAAPITLNLELEAGKMIANMLGYDSSKSWSHITSGGTVANMEALWAARQNQLNGLAFQEVCIKYHLPFVIALPNGSQCDIRQIDKDLIIRLRPDELVNLPRKFEKGVAEMRDISISLSILMEEVKYGSYSITRNGLSNVYGKLGIEPVILASQAAHYSIRKIANILGLGERNVIMLPVNNSFQVDIPSLKSIIGRLKPHQPIMTVIGILGTTEEGAVDPIAEILNIRNEMEKCSNHSFWFHVDAAWGGYLRCMHPDSNSLSSHVKKALSRVGEADSITIDPHKMGFIPYPAGVINFKEKAAVLHSHQLAPYITLDHGGPHALDDQNVEREIGPYIIEGSKSGASALATWLAHKTIPLTPEGHGRIIESSLNNTKAIYEKMLELQSKDLSDSNCSVVMQPVAIPDTNVICYFFTSKVTISLEQQNQLNQQIYHAFSLQKQEGAHAMPYRQEYFISHTHFFPSHYPFKTVVHLLHNLDHPQEAYENNGLFILRSVIMNPWLDQSAAKGKDHLTELLVQIRRKANEIAIRLMNNQYQSID